MQRRRGEASANVLFLAMFGPPSPRVCERRTVLRSCLLGVFDCRTVPRTDHLRKVCDRRTAPRIGPLRKVRDRRTAPRIGHLRGVCDRRTAPMTGHLRRVCDRRTVLRGPLPIGGLDRKALATRRPRAVRSARTRCRRWRGSPFCVDCATVARDPKAIRSPSSSIQTLRPSACQRALSSTPNTSLSRRG